MAEQIGHYLGNYLLARLLGAGNFANVYLGEHRYLEIPAAIKVLHVRMEPETHASFQREAHTIARLQHPHIIHVQDFGVEDQTPYLVMEYTPNGTLRTRHPKGSRLSLEQIVTYVKQIASALDYAHKHHVIHCDVKPENLLLNDKGEIVLSDFGLSLVQPTLDTPLSIEHIAGTPLYMAPEQILRHPCPASDQYALGVMVYEWLSGTSPFSGFGAAILGQHLYQAPPSLCANLPELSPAVENVVFGALAKDPTQRFTSVQDFAAVLEEVCCATHILSSTTGEGLSPKPHVTLSNTLPFPVTSAPPLASPLYQQGQPTPPPAKQHQTISIHALSVQLLRSPISPVLRQNRLRLLRRVNSFWIDGVLEHSLHGAAFLALGLETRRDTVANPWHLVIQQIETTPHSLPSGTRITQVYDAADGELLILGAPGSGKTTLLLELARDLLKRARQDEEHPIPVIFNLSSWAIKQQPLADWMTEELNIKYQVPRKLARSLCEAEQILPLLDGLDEVAPMMRTRCIEAINSYRQDHGLFPLVVCSRATDYLAQAGRILLRNAVMIQPLTYEQITTYLANGGEALWALRIAIHKDVALRELACSPLMLSILTLTYHDLPVEELLRQPSLQTRQHLLFSHYVSRMFSRHGTHPRFPSQRCIPWLAALARQLRSHNQTVFYLEQIHPDWLPPTLYPAYHWLGIRLPAVLLGMLAGLIVFLFLQGALDNTASLLLMTLQGGLLGALFSSSSHPALPSSQARRIPPTPLGRPLACLAIGALYAVCSGIGLDYAPALWLQGGCIVAGCMALAWWALLSVSPHLGALPGHRLLDLLAHPRIWLVASLLGTGLGLANALSRWLTAGQFLGPDSGLGLEQLALPNNWVLSGLLVALGGGLSCALSCALIAGSSRAQTGELPLTERVCWTGRSLLHSLLSGSHLRTAYLLSVLLALLSGLIVALDVGVLSGLSQAWNNALIEGPCFGLSVGLSYWLLLGLFQGIAQERLLDQDRRLINEGIHRCARNGLLLGLLGGGLIGLIGLLSAVLSIGLSNWLSGQPPALNDWLLMLLALLGSGALLSLLGACFLGLLSGGLTLWRHFLLRLLLARSRLFPWPAPAFLAEMATRLLLQRVGGGYSFMHRLLLDYFADLHPLSEAPVPVSGSHTAASPPVLR